MQAAEEVADYPLFFRDRLSDWVGMQVAIRRMVDSGARAIFIDHLHLIEMAGRASEIERLSQVTRQMARLAKRLQVPLIVLAQINREADRGDRSPRPRMSMLRTCGEGDADDVILLYRPGYYDDAADKSLCECIVAKQRNGPTGMAKLKFHAETGLFTDWFDQPALF
jgi:replicative DNA helicase